MVCGCGYVSSELQLTDAVTMWNTVTQLHVYPVLLADVTPRLVTISTPRKITLSPGPMTSGQGKYAPRTHQAPALSPSHPRISPPDCARSAVLINYGKGNPLPHTAMA